MMTSTRSMSPSENMTLSAGGCVLRTWNFPDGQIVWESTHIVVGCSFPKIMWTPSFDPLVLFFMDTKFASNKVKGHSLITSLYRVLNSLDIWGNCTKSYTNVFSMWS